MLIKSIRWIVQPLVRFLIRQGITYPVFSEILKKIYVETAEKELSAQGDKVTLSRIFIQTGINRKEVKRLIELQEDPDDGAYQNATLGGLLVSRWIGSPEFCDIYGEPLALPRHSDKNEKGFNDLVESVNKDIHPRTILNEWLKLNIVTIDDNDKIRLNENAFIPQTGFEDKLFFFGRNVSDHISTCVNNLDDALDPKFERAVYYSALTMESIDKLQAMAREKSIELINQLNEEALALKLQDLEKSGTKHRMRFGCFWFDTPHVAEQDKASLIEAEQEESSE